MIHQLARLSVAVILLLGVCASGHSQPATLEGATLYKVSTVRAAVGSLQDLLDWAAALQQSDFYQDAGDSPPLIMRHSQGDQWDLLFITPMGGWMDFYSVARAKRRDEAFAAHTELFEAVDGMIAFEEDHFAYGPPFADVRKAYRDNSFFHIEMFAAAPGKSAELFEQRRMENAYLTATGQVANMIFRRAAGSDVDVFTVGSHKSLEAFAAPASVTDDEKELAAKAAGFKDRADISFYLRSLISSHHDTLAVKVD